QENGNFQLKTGLDDNKDQSYFLHLLNQEQLSKSLFPLGEITKLKVRKIAAENGFITANKKDSTGICFIGERPFAQFLQTYLPKKPGAIVDENGRFIKHHQGLAFYTIGQRKGLEIGGGFSTSGKPWFVADKRLESNELVVVQGEHPLLYHQSISALAVHWITKTPKFPLKCTAKIRYRQASQKCVVAFENGIIKVDFEQAQRAATPGQSVVFYADDVCLGGAIIENRF
ncbi:MAG: tRNA 2-thiouridine(34) synthase MnmA, partial [Candidatus Thioglobus sp.]